MLKFFRRIRQRLIQNGNLRKYLLYATGEIILVMVGILLALQVNNWNEARKSNHQQRNYLQLIKKEMTNNLQALDFEKKRLAEQLTGLREFVSHTDQGIKNVTENQISETWGKVFSKTIQLQNENGALTALISSGGLKEIKNDSIRNTLALWDGLMQKVNSQERELNSYIQKGNDYLEKNGNVRTIIDISGGNSWWRIDPQEEMESNIFLLESSEFENILVFAIGTGQSLYDSRYQVMEQRMTNLIRQIDEELAK